MNTDTLRQKYLNFFAGKGHKIVPSGSLVPLDDPTVLFTSAGMAQFKKEFLGQVTDVRRAASCQRCLRTDDLEKVGVTSAHHTFFEMLGNFSFGDYFKEEAISWAWEFLLDELAINPRVLWVSVYQEDEEAYRIWKNKIKFPESRIVKLGPKENFWPANAIEDGPNGPCGPCSEIFFDYGKDAGCKRPDCDPGCSCGRFVEIWNLVFTQFNRKDNGVLEPLPNKNIDTGMGLERMASVLQGVKSNFEIDIFKPIITEIISFAGSSPRNQLLYAIADHIRAVTFAIYDGVMPSNEQRGYVVRKLIRKAELHGQAMGIKEPFLHKLAPAVAEVFVKTYPELKSGINSIVDIIHDEEKLFTVTLKDAPRILKEEFKAPASSSGHIAFKLYDTYGIPLEITKSWAQEKGIEINEEEFREDLRQQKERSKKASKISEGIFVSSGLDLGVKESKFLGYRGLSVDSAKILRIIKDSKMVKQALAGESCQIILDKTPFYGESGGQIGDRGRIIKGKSVFSVEDTLSQDKVIIHCGRQDSGKLKAGDLVNCAVDRDFRQAAARAHTATHLLQWALREVLGAGIRQAGSLVEQDRLRFDFIYTQKVSHEDLLRVEELVQKRILNGDTVAVKEMPLARAKKVKALAFFEEKYASKVRLVDIGGYSKELCGGTHLVNSSSIGLFKIVSEGSIAKGIRRIEALCGELAWKRVREDEEKLLSQLQDKMNSLGRMEKELARLKSESFSSSVGALVENSENLNGIKLICNKYPNVEAQGLRKIADLIRSKAPSYAACLAAYGEKGAQVIIGFSEDLVKKGFLANEIIKDVAKEINGSGGGRPQMAQAGSSDAQGIDRAIAAFKEIVRGALLK